MACFPRPGPGAPLGALRNLSRWEALAERDA